MTDADRFLDLAALELVRQEGVRVVKSPSLGDGLSVPGWEDWDQLLVADGPGSMPAIFAFVHIQANLDEVHRLNAEAVNRVVARNRMGQGGNAPVRLVAIFLFDSVDAGLARKVAGLVPEQYYPGLKPQAWAVDLSSRRLWAPRAFGVLPSRASRAVKKALALEASGANVEAAAVEAAERRSASARSQFVAQMRGNAPIVTYGLLALIVAVFLLEALSSPGGFGRSEMPARILLRFGALDPALVQRGEIWLLFTAMFVHVSFTHILFNGISLYVVGTLVERIYGSVRYLVIYLVSGVMASLASYLYFELVTPGQVHQVAAGASGAIFGVAGALIVLGVLRRSVVPRSLALYLSLFMLLLIGANLAVDAFTPEIDTRAHVGGLVVGFILGYLVAPRLREPEATPDLARQGVAG